MIRRMITLAALSAAWPAQAQEAPTPPDPATVSIPDLSGGRDPDVVRNGWKYFYFWRADTSFAEAYADFYECYRFMPVSMVSNSLPMFAPWEERTNSRIYVPDRRYGLVGDLMAGLFIGAIERRAHQSRLRRCLEPRGYQRYPLEEGRWKKLADNFSDASIAAQAKAASGPAPDGEPLPEDR